MLLLLTVVYSCPFGIPRVNVLTVIVFHSLYIRLLFVKARYKCIRCVYLLSNVALCIMYAHKYIILFCNDVAVDIPVLKKTISIIDMENIAVCLLELTCLYITV